MLHGLRYPFGGGCEITRQSSEDWEIDSKELMEGMKTSPTAEKKQT
jgi:hypothetical protein